MKHERLLIAERALPGAFGNGVGDTARQRADAGVREENFVARDGKFVPAQFLVGRISFKRHAAKLIGEGRRAKVN